MTEESFWGNLKLKTTEHPLMCAIDASLMDSIQQEIPRRYEKALKLAVYHSVIKPAMELNRIDRKKLAKQLHCNVSTFSKYETGSSAPDRSKLDVMCRYLGMNQTIRPRQFSQMLWTYRVIVRRTTEIVSAIAFRQRRLAEVLHIAEAHFLIDSLNCGQPLVPEHAEAIFDQVSENTKSLFPYFSLGHLRTLLETDGLSHCLAVKLVTERYPIDLPISITVTGIAG